MDGMWAALRELESSVDGILLGDHSDQRQRNLGLLGACRAARTGRASEAAPALERISKDGRKVSIQPQPLPPPFRKSSTDLRQVYC
jgi:hypothetical protein